MQEIQSQDGFVDNLYLYLWMQDPILKQVPNINIPETIIYRNNRIFQWYFYGDKQIKKKSKNKLNSENVLEKFLKNVPKCGIVAVWIQRQQGSAQKPEKLIYDYLDQEGLKKFLNNKTPNEIREGILQQFVVPKSDKNQVIKVIWSQNLCFFEKIESTRKINDKNQDIYQRVLTYEIPNTNSVIKQMKGVYLMQTLENQSHIIKQHIANISFERFKITQMTLIFKLNEKEEIKLISCTNIKVQDKKFDNQQKKNDKFQKTEIGVPSNIDLSKMSIQRPINMKLDNSCGSCQNKIDEFSTYPIKMKYVIQSWDFDHDGKKQQIIDKEKSAIEQRKLQAEHNYSVTDFKSKTSLSKTIQKGQIFLDIEKSYNIPKVLRNLMPKLKEERYYQLKNNPGFLDKDVEVCEKCYLDMMASCNIKDDFSKLKKHIQMQTDLNGVGQLKPEVLNSRFNRTRKQIQIRNLFEEEGIQFDPEQTEYEFNGYFQLSGDTQDDTKKYNSVLNKVGLKVFQRSQHFINTLNKDIVKENTKPIHVIRNINQRQSYKQGLLERSKTKTQYSISEENFNQQSNGSHHNLNQSKEVQNQSQSTSKIFPSQNNMNQSYANTSQEDTLRLKNVNFQQLEPIYSHRHEEYQNQKSTKRSQKVKYKSLKHDLTMYNNQYSMHSTTHYPSILTNEKSQDDICTADIKNMLPNFKEKFDQKNVNRNTSMPQIKNTTQNSSILNLKTIQTPSVKDKFLDSFCNDNLPFQNIYKPKKQRKNLNQLSQSSNHKDLKSFYKTHAHEFKKFKRNI